MHQVCGLLNVSNSWLHCINYPRGMQSFLSRWLLYSWFKSLLLTTPRWKPVGTFFPAQHCCTRAANPGKYRDQRRRRQEKRERRTVNVSRVRFRATLSWPRCVAACMQSCSHCKAKSDLANWCRLCFVPQKRMITIKTEAVLQSVHNRKTETSSNQNPILKQS